MPRAPRVDFPGALHHACVATHHRRRLFEDPAVLHDLHILFGRLGEWGIEVLCFAIMNDHFHLLVRSTSGQLSLAMDRVLGVLGQRQNARMRQVGAVLERPFWSRLLSRESQARYLAAYIVRNPMRRGGGLSFGSRTSHDGWLDPSALTHWQHPGACAELFGTVEGYLDYLEAFDASRAPPDMHRICKGLQVELMEAMKDVSAVYGVRLGTLAIQARGARPDRMLLAWWLHERDGVSRETIARTLGIPSPTVRAWCREAAASPQLEDARTKLWERTFGR